MENYLNTNIELVCFSKVITVWSFNQGTLLNNCIVEFSDDLEKGMVNVLTIVNATYSNEGRYECIPYNHNFSEGGFVDADYADVKIYSSPARILKGS